MLAPRHRLDNCRALVDTSAWAGVIEPTWLRSNLTREEWVNQCRSHGKINKQRHHGWRSAGVRVHGKRRGARPHRPPGTVSRGGAEVLRAADQRGAGLGCVLPVLRRSEGAAPGDWSTLPSERPVLYSPPQRRDSVAPAAALQQW